MKQQIIEGASHLPQKKYLILTYQIPEEQYERAYAALAFQEFVGITEGLDELSICFNIYNEQAISVIEENTINELNKFQISYKLKNKEIIIEKNWNKEWEDSIEPVHVNESLIVTPSWKRDFVQAETVLVINPQMSFGSGHHETTSMMAAYIQECVEPESDWIDAGTGTGLLAILAVMQGAKSVFAFDNDEWSVLNTQENIALNPIEPTKIRIEQADVFTVELPKVHGIAANLHKNLIKPNLSRFYHALAPKDDSSPAHLLVSGILRYDVEDVVAEAVSIGFHHKETRIKGDWVALHFHKM